MDKIICEDCGKEYDDEHVMGEGSDIIRDCAEFDGWKFGFFTMCPDCKAE